MLDRTAAATRDPGFGAAEAHQLWREASQVVRATYASWAEAPDPQAFADYRAALNWEELVADVYRLLAEREAAR